MSKKLLYECLECETKFILPELDGRACFVCDGYLNAVREVKPGEFVGAQRTEPIKEKSIAARLQYLDRLLDIARLNDVTGVLRNELAKRMAPVCDSIEKDLGLSDKFNVGDLTVKLNVDTSEFVEKMKNIADEMKKGGVIKTNETIVIGGKDSETIVPFNPSTHAVTGMYKREWSGLCTICHQEHGGHTLHCHANDVMIKRPDGVDGL